MLHKLNTRNGRVAKGLFRTVCLFVFVFQIGGNTAYSQSADTLNYQQVHFFKLNQANDLFTVLFQSDKYYTDGIDMELAHSIFNNKVADAVLLGFKKSPYKDFSLSLNQDIYTPKNTSLTDVDSTDRPYAGQLFMVYAKYSNQFWKAKKIVSSVYMGVQGPAAFAKEVQNGVHKLISNKEVMGWDNQLSNGLILDYQLQYLQLIPVSSPITELHYFGTARVGALNNLAEAGLRFKIGRYTDTYMNFFGIYNPRYQQSFTAIDVQKMSSNRRKMIPKRLRNKSFEQQAIFLNQKISRKFQLYLYTELKGTYWLRDGSVQGSLIQFSPNKYELKYYDYEHFVVGGRYGVVLQYARFFMEYSRYITTDKYTNNGFFGYGRLILSWAF